MTTQAERLRMELAALKASWDRNGRSQAESLRMDAIREALAKLARRAKAGRAYRQTLYDLNGHHGKA